MTEHDMFASVISLRPDFETNANDVSALVKSLLAANPYIYSLSLLYTQARILPPFSLAAGCP